MNILEAAKILIDKKARYPLNYASWEQRQENEEAIRVWYGFVNRHIAQNIPLDYWFCYEHGLDALSKEDDELHRPWRYF